MPALGRIPKGTLLATPVTFCFQSRARGELKFFYGLEFDNCIRKISKRIGMYQIDRFAEVGTLAPEPLNFHVT